MSRPERYLCRQRGVPERHLRRVLDAEPEETGPLVRVREWLAGSQGVLVLAGNLGTGKSAAAAWACTETDGLFVRASDLSHSFGFGDEAHRTLRRLREFPLLVVDDLGAEFGDSKGFFDQGFTSLMCARYDGCLRTVVTTNLGPAEFQSRYPHLVDRLREDGAFYEAVGQSLRGK